MKDDPRREETLRRLLSAFDAAVPVQPMSPPPGLLSPNASHAEISSTHISFYTSSPSHYRVILPPRPSPFPLAGPSRQRVSDPRSQKGPSLSGKERWRGPVTQTQLHRQSCEKRGEEGERGGNFSKLWIHNCVINFLETSNDELALQSKAKDKKKGR